MRARTAAIADAACATAFVAIGRASHDDGLVSGGSLVALSPFAASLLAGWLVSRAWRRPEGVATGAIVWLVTVAGGVLLRSALPGRGLEPSFVLVTAITLGVLLVGWRALAAVRLRGGPDAGTRAGARARG